MTPYMPMAPLRAPKLIFSALFFIVLQGQTALAGEASAVFDALTRSGLDHYYSLEYEPALKDFQKAAELEPENPHAYNHVLETVLFRELYNHNALDTSLYTQEGFVNRKQIVLSPEVKQQIKDLTDKALALSEKRLKDNPKDADALYARGVTRGLHATYLGLVEKSWFSALRSAFGSRSDHEAVLALQPNFVDAKTVVGIHNYVVAVLPLRTRILASMVGVTGDKKKGLDYLAEAGKSGRESSEDARVALALFLRREQRYPEAVAVVQTLVKDHPRNFLYALEEANLLKDGGQGQAAITAYRSVLADWRDGRYSAARPELAEFGLGETLRGQNQYPEALQAYEAAGAASNDDHDLRQRALVGAGEVSDLLTKRDQALKEYQAAIALDSSSNEAEIARRYLAKPYQGK